MFENYTQASVLRYCRKTVILYSIHLVDKNIPEAIEKKHAVIEKFFPHIDEMLNNVRENGRKRIWLAIFVSLECV